MLELISQMSQFGGLASIAFIILLLFAVREGYNFVVQAQGVFNQYHTVKQEKTDQETLINNLNSTVALLSSRVKELETRLADDRFRERVPKLENAMIEKDTKIELIIQELSNVSKSLENAEKERRKNIVDTNRSAMYRLYLEAKTNGYVTHASLENFLNLADTYLNMGGNSYYKKVIIPNYLKLPVKSTDDDHSLENDMMLQSVKDKLEE